MYRTIYLCTKHSQNTYEKQAPRRLAPVVQDHDPTTHPRNTHETPTRARNHHLKTLTDSQRSHIIGQRSHCANFSSRWPPGRRTDDGRRRTTHKFARRAPATGESSRARSFARSHARTHATQTQAQSKSISRFGGRTKACTTPPTSNLTIYLTI